MTTNDMPHILVVEDSQDHAELILRSIESAMMPVALSVAGNLSHARALLAARQVDLIIADLHLPDGEGTDLLPGDPAQRQHALIVLTGRGDEAAAAAAIRRGAFDYIVKCPRNFDNLPRTIQRTLREWEVILASRRAEEALRENEARLRLSAEAGNVGLWDWNLKSNTVYYSPEWKRQIGYRDDEISDHFDEWQNRVHPDDLAPTLKKISDFLASSREQHETEFRFRHKDGGYRWIYARADAMRDVDGKPERMLGCHIDITRRKLAEEALRALASRQEAILVAVPDIIAEVDKKKVYTWMNRAGLEFFGDDALGKQADSFFSDEQDTYAAVQVLFDGASGSDVVYVESWQRRRDGQNRLLAWWCRALRDANGAVTGALSTAHDITDRKLAEEALRVANARHEQAAMEARQLAVRAEAASRAKSEFLANMSHEIRTPMTAILGYVELLMMPNVSIREQRESLAGIQRNGRALMDLISDILDLSLVEADRIVLGRSEFPLRQVVGDVVSAVKLRADAKKLNLEVRYEDTLPDTIYTDSVRLRQILTNLVGNAIKFTERGTIRLVIRRAQGNGRPERIQFAVCDTGPGIRSNQLGELFRPFSQLDGSVSRRYGGIGLGLAISKRLAELLGGDLEVASDFGKGSTFTLTIESGTLPHTGRLESPHAARNTEETPSPRDDMPPMSGRILLAEDSVEVSSVVRLVLQKMGLEVDVAEDGEIVCEMAGKSRDEGRPYDLILMDIQMPNMDGYEAARWLRHHGWRGPIVALTAHAMTGDREKCLEAGCTDYICKPLSRTTLKTTIARYCGKSVATDRLPPAGEKELAGAAGLFDGGLFPPEKAVRLVKQYARDLPGRAGAINAAFAQGNLPTVAILAHQLNGSAGTYGLASIADTAGRLYQEATCPKDMKIIEATVRELQDLCRQAVHSAPPIASTPGTSGSQVSEFGL